MLGHPVAHSLSPVLHAAAYRELGLHGWAYDAIDVDETGLPAVVEAARTAGWAGLSLTMPLKRAVRPLLARESELAAQVGAVNTVTFGPEGPVGDNTDVHGIVAALTEAAGPDLRGVPGVPVTTEPAVTGAVVLGGGATAASALAALRNLGYREPVVHVRSQARAGDLLEAAVRLGVAPRLAPLDPPSLRASLAAAPAVVVSTLPAGAADALTDVVAEATSRPGSAAPPVLLDVVYAPWPTALAAAWQHAGGRVVGGFSMLLHQAAEQVRLMTGLEPPVVAMRAAGEAELLRREQAHTTG